MFFVLVSSLAFGSGPVDPTASSICAGVDCGPSFATTTSLDLKLRSVEGQDVLNKILGDTAFWSGAWQQAYEGKEYDEIRLKDTASGFVPMITGEGNQDFPHEVVSDIVYYRNTDLPKYMSGAKAVIPLGSGYDPVVGAEYRDSFYILDLTVFYGYFPQRMYRKHDDAKNQSVMWFEKMNASFVDAGTWTTYQQKMTAAIDGMDKRWPPFNAVVEVGDVYGMFVVEPGKARTSRVSFVSKLTFADDAGWIAQWGSQLPPVLRSGLKSGFVASVAIAKAEADRRAKKAAAAQPAPAAPVP
ncbi:MAG: hypothetical protein ABMB14_14660 [Myxococcota bacterium]